MWRSVFLHEFPNGDVRNFHGLPGSAAPGSFEIHPNAVIPGQRFSYELTEPLDDVIGFSGRLRIRKPVTGRTDSWLLLRAGDDVEFRIQELDGLVLPGPSSKARGLLRIGPNPLVDIGTLVFPHREFVDVRFDWHTSGQARLIRNRQLVGYHNAVAPGTQITIYNITVGRSDVPIGWVGPRLGLDRIFVRVLRRSDSLAVLSELLPTSEIKDDPQLARCRHLAVNDLLSISEVLRPFMVKFHQKESTAWSLDSSPQPSPFSSASSSAHKRAVEAGTALIHMAAVR